MPDTDLHQPVPGPPRAAADAAELAQAAPGLAAADGYRLADSDPLAPLARDVAPLLTEAALTIGGTLRAFRYAARPSGSHGACMATSHRGQETEAGR
jgi:hypothetical protein